ncbi:serine O-acetyltransferase [Flavisolibacter nicotianae]|uniref:serine O-acetyltransferase n=1 Tax=Flavisolibacter nicotianae TaxID=2364882 RepID=UPI000EAC0F97|nr:serine O-acetyltransferase [Flavisolibacter nicotianae]
MDSLVLADLYRYTGKRDRKTLLKTLINVPTFRYLFFFRMVVKYKRNSVQGLIARYFYHRYTFKYGIQIPKEVKIGGGLHLPHFGGIVFNSRSVIGSDCTILQGVTLGNTKRGKNKGAPTLGNHVYIGPGAVVVGNITVGNNVMIAANSFVNFDVPSNSIVIGNPGNIIANAYATAGYIVNSNSEYNYTITSSSL